jgi:L-asparaginase/Glu-tRNA(Gln) amidotransferase subunit D
MGDMKREESIRILITGGTIDKEYDPLTGELTPLLHKDVVESTACPHQKAVSTFLPPAQRASWPGGRITSPVE